MSRGRPVRRLAAGLALLLVGAAGVARPSIAAAQAAANACTAVGWQGVSPFTTYAAGQSITTNPPVWSLAVDGGKDLAVVGLNLTPGTNTTVFTGRPESLTWAASDLSGIAIADIAIRGGPGREVWAGGIGESGKAFDSDNGGLEFHSANSDPSLDVADSMAMTSDRDGVIAAATRAKPDLPVVLRYSAGRWDPYGDMSDVNSAGRRLLWDVAVGPLDRGWLAVDGRGLWRLDRPVDRWTQVGDDSLNSSTIVSILIDPQNGNHLFAGLGPPQTGGGSSYQKGLRESIDAGLSWGPATLSDAIAVTSIVLNAKQDRLYASAWQTGLWLSRDDGLNWQHLPGPPSPFVRRMAMVVPAGQTATTCELLFAGTYSGLFVRNMARAVDYSVFMPIAGAVLYVR